MKTISPSPAGVPGDGDIVFIPSGPIFPYTVTVSANSTVLGISLGAVTLDITNSAFFEADEGTATGTNLGLIDVEAGSRFFGGVFNNQNKIDLRGTGAAIASAFLLGDTTLKGGGTFSLSNDTINNNIRGFDTLTNVDNSIKGAGVIQTDIVNQALGTIKADSNAAPLVLELSNITNTGMLLGAGTGGLDLAGSVVTNIGGTIQADAGFVFLEDSTKVIGGRLNSITNTGTMEATGGDLYIASPLSNTGLLIADAFSLVAAQASTGGTAKLDDSGQIEFGGPTTTAVRFDDGSLTSLVLDDSVHFKGIISNFGKFNTAQTIDLLDINATGHIVSYAAGVLTIKDNQNHTAQLHFSGAYSFNSFHLNPDGHGGSVLTDPPAASAATAALFGSHIAAAFPASSNGFNGFAARYDTFTQPLLAPTPHG